MEQTYASLKLLGEWRMTEPLPNPREDSRGLTEPSVNARILALAADGLKVRDISSLLHIHPQIVIRTLADSGNGAGAIVIAGPPSPDPSG